MPKVSVILPIYNSEKYIKKSVKSILEQSFSDFEIIAINDGSIDKSLSVIESFRDKRIKIFNNYKNIGISASLNFGIQNSSGEYIARMDADDICLSNRLKNQIYFLDQNLSVDVVGSYFKTFGCAISRKICPPLQDDQIKAGLLFNAVLGHPVVMMRKDRIIASKLKYDSNYDGAEDYELWVRGSSKLCFANIPQVLLLYRIHPKQISSEKRREQMNIADSIRIKYLSNLNVSLTEREKEIHLGVCRNDISYLNNFKTDEILKWKNSLVNQIHHQKLSDAVFDEIRNRFQMLYYQNFFKFSLRHKIKEIIFKMDQDETKKVKT